MPFIVLFVACQDISNKHEVGMSEHITVCTWVCLRNGRVFNQMWVTYSKKQNSHRTELQIRGLFRAQ